MICVEILYHTEEGTLVDRIYLDHILILLFEVDEHTLEEWRSLYKNSFGYIEFASR